VLPNAIQFEERCAIGLSGMDLSRRGENEAAGAARAHNAPIDPGRSYPTVRAAVEAYERSAVVLQP
jgi:hypothetical protein